MVFSIPETAIDASHDSSFTINSRANILFVALLAWNWKGWSSAFEPVEWMSFPSENETQLLNEQVTAGYGDFLWTVMGVDEGEYMEPGIEQRDSNGFSTHGYAKTTHPRSGVDWSPNWHPDWRLHATGFTVQFPTDGPIKTVWVGCEICSAEDNMDDCPHTESGAQGSWVSVDFEIGDEGSFETLLEESAEDSELGPLSVIAASALIEFFLRPRGEADKIALISHKAAETLSQLSDADRDLASNDSIVVSSIPSFDA
jgi:hypothetical protein